MNISFINIFLVIVFQIFSVIYVQADTLIVKVSLTDSEPQKKIDQDVALPAGLAAVDGLYHTTLGFIENVPSDKAQAFKHELYRFLSEEVHPVKMSALEFNVKRATTFRQLGSLNYSGKEVILFPKESNRRKFMKMNEVLSDFVTKTAKISTDYRHISMGNETRTYRYIPHITLNTPDSIRKTADSIQSAITKVNQYLSLNPIIFKLNEYRISIHSTH